MTYRGRETDQMNDGCLWGQMAAKLGAGPGNSVDG